MYKPKLLIRLTACALGVALGGCAIRPEPLDLQTVIETARADRENAHLTQDPITQSLTLSDVMARAVKYNLDNRVQRMSEALADTSYELIKMDMLPLLGVNAGYFDRDNIDASRSYNIITGQDNFSYSTSQERQYSNADLTFSFNILDFGVSYLQAKQEGDRFFVSGLGRRKVILRLLEQTRSAYWRAVAMQSVQMELDDVLIAARQSLSQLEQVRADQLATPQVVLQDTRALLELVQQLEEMEQSVNLALVDLSTLINEDPGKVFSVRAPSELPSPPSLPANIESLELVALVNSADYVSEMYNVRVDQLESRKALVRLLPGLEFSYSGNYLSNSFLYNDTWGLAGVRLTGNLMRLLTSPALRRQNAAREELAETKRLTMNMAVVTGVHLSWQQYQNSIVRYERALQLEAVDQELSALSEQSLASNAASGISRIQNRTRALRSTLAKYMTYADLQTAYGAFLTSLSLDPVPLDYQNMPIDQLAPSLDMTYQGWESGRLPDLSMVDTGQ